jgi:hypothetical protein
MQKLTDEAILKAKLGKIRSHVDFQGMLSDMIKTDCADILADAVSLLFAPKLHKTFGLMNIDSALSVRPPRYQEAEKVTAQQPEEIVFDDELEEQRIRDNYVFITDNLYMALNERETFTLEQFNEMMKRHYGDDIVRNADYYSFFVNLCQKQRYHLGGDGKENESFLDACIAPAFADADSLDFTIEPAKEAQTIELFDNCEVANVAFARC